MQTASTRVSKVDYVYSQLRASIINGERTPGDFLDKAELGRQYDASRQPLASAIDRLVEDGLVRVVPQHGSFVAKLDANQIFGRFFVRRAIETEYALAAAPCVTDEMLAKLDLNLSYQKAARQARDLDEFYALDKRFHAIIHEVIRVSEALRQLQRTEAYIELVRRLMLPEPKRTERTYKEHVAIRNALATRDPSNAAKAMREHLEAVEKEFTNFATKRPELFERKVKAPTLGR